MSTMTTSKVTLAQLKACKGGVGGYYRDKLTSVAIAAGHDDVLYLTNSYALARADRFAEIWKASNLELGIGWFVLNGHVQPDLEATVPNLAAITQHLADAPEIEPIHIAGRQVVVDADGDCYLFGDINAPVAAKRQLINVYLGDYVPVWRSAGPSKPLSAWLPGGEFIGCVMPVRLS